MNKKLKIVEDFLQDLSSEQMQDGQDAWLLSGSIDDQTGGTNGKCTNTGGCDNSINEKKCTNRSCSSSAINSKTCNNAPGATGS